ncbi:MAG: sigma-54 dependent transcriptional regulator [Acidobacteriota bacterium]|nr:sigma-54 dependent transcriptional regulator [Acidobacteriota bacterium]
MEEIEILIIEDEHMIGRSLQRKLEKEGYHTIWAREGAEAREHFTRLLDLVLLDINLPDANGLDLLAEIHELDRDLPVIMMTGVRSVESVVEAMKRGATDYLTKPFNLDEVILTIKKTLEITELRREVRTLRANRGDQGLDQVVGESDAMLEVLEIGRTVAESEAETLLILGESGTGKNLLARAIHNQSGRSGKPFMEITCSALPEPLLESELFGHERGAFTNAHTMKKGLCELAHRGTLFLDEIGDMPLGLQAKLLGFLESRSLRRVGGTRRIDVDVRIIAATNRNMDDMIRDNRFREDLYYRLNVIEITMPSMRERPEDVMPMVRYFIDHFNRKFNKRVQGLEKDAETALKEYHWPGNVRELRNAVERAMILTRKDRLTLNDFPMRTRQAAPITEGEHGITLPPRGISLDFVSRELVRQALERTKGNQTKAAKLLHISRDQLRYRMKQDQHELD